MAKYKKRSYGKLSAGTVAVLVLVFIVLYVFDAIGGAGNNSISGDCEFHFVDVGQGDCAMIISEEAVVVIDAGPQDHAESTEKYIKSYTDTIDYLILTHPHEDHIGGADELFESIKVKNVLLSDAYTDTVTFTKLLDVIDKSGANVIEAKAGDSYNAGDIKFTVLAPLSEFTDLNDYSVVTKVEYGSTSAIITGDVEHNNERLMAEEYTYFGLHANIYQVAHHGSSTSNHEDFIDAVSPDFAVIQCGEDNSYGHPHFETIDKLEERKIPYYRTDKMGHIVFVSDGKDVWLAD
ncbi:MAG: MBL fold metallo-hydrolase [Ruminococcaceae bacterium]|nr:MBL fold metallo-hydrolase [Oscillospiraceae bacterium]